MMLLHIEEAEKKMLFFSSLLPSNEAFTFELLLLFLDARGDSGGSVLLKKEIRDFRSFSATQGYFPLYSVL